MLHFMGCVNRRNPGLTKEALTLCTFGTVGKGFPSSPGKRRSAPLPPPSARSSLSSTLFICLQIRSKVTFSLGSCLLSEQSRLFVVLLRRRAGLCGYKWAWQFPKTFNTWRRAKLHSDWCFACTVAYGVDLIMHYVSIQQRQHFVSVS